MADAPARMNVESFNLDHRAVAAPFIRLADRKEIPGGSVISKYDIRFAQPNEAHLEMPVVHSLEHLFAEHSRNHSAAVIDFSPMGCQTGFYLILAGEPTEDEVADLVAATLADVLTATEVPAANEVQCGWGANHSLGAAQAAAAEFLAARDSWKQVLEMTTAIVCVAIDAEASPFLRLAENQGAIRRIGTAGFVHLDFGGHDVLLIRSGIGQTNAAAALTAAIVADAAAASGDGPAPWSFGANKWAPRVVISAGTAGGLGSDVHVGDVVVSTETAYSMANAVAFGYEYGQIPGMPRRYAADEAAVAAALTAQLEPTRDNPGGRVHAGLIVSQDAFINATAAYDIRGQFPDVLATDMETTAIAQVAYNFEIPFVAVRGISDLCGPEAGSDHRSNADGAARASAEVVRAVLAGLS